MFLFFWKSSVIFSNSGCQVKCHHETNNLYSDSWCINDCNVPVPLCLYQNRQDVDLSLIIFLSVMCGMYCMYPCLWCVHFLLFYRNRHVLSCVSLALEKLVGLEAYKNPVNPHLLQISVFALLRLVLLNFFTLIHWIGDTLLSIIDKIGNSG